MTKTFEATLATTTPTTTTSNPSANENDSARLQMTPKPPEKSAQSSRYKPPNAACAPPTINDAAPGSAAVNLAEEKSVTNLDDEGLRALLDEAINYKRPKDREGKSKLFNSLLSDAEDEIRKKHAYNASGPARHFNTTAKKRHRQQQRRQASSSISENLAHGGSLNDLVKQELYESCKMQRPAKSVSSRQREGGSLPCNVNANIDRQFFVEEDATSRRVQWVKHPPEESQRLLEDDTLQETQQQQLQKPPEPVIEVPTIFGRLATDDMDEGIFPQMQPTYEFMDGMTTHVVRHLSPPAGSRSAICRTEKKLDENGNALSGSSALDLKKQKRRKRKEAARVESQEIAGHRADIIDDIDSLVSFIDGTEDKVKPRKAAEKKKARKKVAKANSLEEISGSKLESCFDAMDMKVALPVEKTQLRPTKSNAERGCRAHVARLASSSEHLANVTAGESNDFIFVTKKKKSKKRRNSLGSRGEGSGKAHGEARPAEFHSLRIRTGSPRRSIDKSNDTSDNESVKSLPIEDAGGKQAISYAEIAKSSERPKWNRPPSERRKQIVGGVTGLQGVVVGAAVEEVNVKEIGEAKAMGEKMTDTDLSSLQNWPEIRNNRANVCKSGVLGDNHVGGGQDWPVISGGGGGKGVSAAADGKLQNDVGAKDAKTAIATGRNASVMVKEPTGDTKTPNHPEMEIKEIKSNPKETPMKPAINMSPIVNNTQQILQHVSEQQQPLYPIYQYKMPPNIRDVQSIEKMQMRSLHPAQHHNDATVESSNSSNSTPLGTSNSNGSSTCSSTSSSSSSNRGGAHRPAVVILSNRTEKHVVDITFGFDINEQLLSGDVCADFINRFYLPDVPMGANAHVDKLVNYIGTEWQDVMMQTQAGRVKYYSDD